MHVQIGSLAVGPSCPVLVIAEAGVNHNGSVATARQLIDAAAQAGANAIKFQTFTAETLALPSAAAAPYQSAVSQQALLASLSLSPESWSELAEYATRQNLLFLSTPFDEASVDLLDPLVPAFKVSSGDLTHHTLLRHISHKGKPVILSTGMASLAEVHDAMDVLAYEGGLNVPIIVLHCTSLYPAPSHTSNLLAMGTMARKLCVPIGYSDHTEGYDVALAAVALGARVIEKHLTTDRGAVGPDHRASLTQSQFTYMVEGIRSVEAALGSAEKVPTLDEIEMRAYVRRSLVTRVPIQAQMAIQPEMVMALRPGTGISPAELPAVVGALARQALPPGHILQWEDLECPEPSVLSWSLGRIGRLWSRS